MANERNRKQGFITHKGRVNTAMHGKYPVKREETLFVDMAEIAGGQVPMPAMVKCADYDEHFIYETPTNVAGEPSFMCTCGSMAVIKDWADAKNRMFVCHLHMESGFHQTSLINSNEREGGLSLGPIDISKRGQSWQ